MRLYGSYSRYSRSEMRWAGAHRSINALDLTEWRPPTSIGRRRDRPLMSPAQSPKPTASRVPHPTTAAFGLPMILVRRRLHG